MQSDEFFMKEAYNQAMEASEINEVPVGAVIVFNNRIIARGHNSTERLKDVTAHAEMLAITSASEALGGKYLKNCTMYVTLEPCVMCAGAINWSQIPKIVYAASDEKRGFLKNKIELHNTCDFVQTEFYKKESAELIINFFKEKRGE